MLFPFNMTKNGKIFKTKFYTSRNKFVLNLEHFTDMIKKYVNVLGPEPE